MTPDHPGPCAMNGLAATVSRPFPFARNGRMETYPRPAERSGAAVFNARFGGPQSRGIPA
jgi:hypothetical protein